MFRSNGFRRPEPSPGPGWVTLPDPKDSDDSGAEDAEGGKIRSLQRANTSSRDHSEGNSRAKQPNSSSREDQELMPPPSTLPTRNVSQQAFQRFIKKTGRKTEAERISEIDGSDSPPAIRRNKMVPSQQHHPSSSQVNQSSTLPSLSLQSPPHIDFLRVKTYSAPSAPTPAFTQASVPAPTSAPTKSSAKSESLERVEDGFSVYRNARGNEKSPVLASAIASGSSTSQALKDKLPKVTVNKTPMSHGRLDAYVLPRSSTQATSSSVKLQSAKKRKVSPSTRKKHKARTFPIVIELSSSDDEPPSNLVRRRLTFSQAGTADDQIVLDDKNSQNNLLLESPPAKRPVKKPVKLRPPKKVLPADYKPMSAGCIELLSSDDETNKVSADGYAGLYEETAKAACDTGDMGDIHRNRDSSILAPPATDESFSSSFVDEVQASSYESLKTAPDRATNFMRNDIPISTSSPRDQRVADNAESVQQRSNSTKSLSPCLPQSTAPPLREERSPIDAEMDEIDALLAPISIPSPTASVMESASLPPDSDNRSNSPPVLLPIVPETKDHDRTLETVKQHEHWASPSEGRQDSTVVKDGTSVRATMSSPFGNELQQNPQHPSLGFFNGAIRLASHKEVDSTHQAQFRTSPTQRTDVVTKSLVDGSDQIAPFPSSVSNNRSSESGGSLVAQPDFSTSVRSPRRDSSETCPASETKVIREKNLRQTSPSDSSGAASLVNVLNAARDRYVRSHIRRPVRIPHAAVDLTGSNSEEEAAEVERSSELLGKLIPGLSAKLDTSQKAVTVSPGQSPKRQSASPALSSAPPKSRVGDLSEITQVRMLAKSRGLSSTPPQTVKTLHPAAQMGIDSIHAPTPVKNSIIVSVNSPASTSDVVQANVLFVSTYRPRSASLPSSSAVMGTAVTPVSAASAKRQMQGFRTLASELPSGSSTSVSVQTMQTDKSGCESDGRISDQLQSTGLKRARTKSTTIDTICEEDLEALNEDPISRSPKKRRQFVPNSSLSASGTSTLEGQSSEDASSMTIIPKLASFSISQEGNIEPREGNIPEAPAGNVLGSRPLDFREGDPPTSSSEELDSPVTSAVTEVGIVDLGHHHERELYVESSCNSGRELFRTAQKEYGYVYAKAKDLPHDLANAVNSIPKWDRNPKLLQQVFESHIMSNTSIDEPDAPPIQIFNEVDIDQDPTPPFEFFYSNAIWHGDGVPPPDSENLKGCDCVGVCDPRISPCSCATRQKEICQDIQPGEIMYDEHGRLKHIGYPIFECNDQCGCTDDCKNRVVQFGRKCHVHIVKTEKKGWGIFAGKRIPKGTFIGIYAGEMITDAEGEERGKLYSKIGRTYLFDIDFWYLPNSADHPVKYTIDAFHAGNFTRFLNHSCDPNCSISPCYINEGNIDKPLLAIFAACDIKEGEELCFSYFGYSDEEPSQHFEQTASQELDPTMSASHNHSSLTWGKCECGAANCKGFLFT